MNSLYLVVMLSLIRLNMITILNYVYFRAVKGEPGACIATLVMQGIM